MEKYDFDEKAVADAIVVWCGDPRLQKIFNEFLSRELKIERPALISLAGSVSPVGIQHNIAGAHHCAFSTFKNQLSFFLNRFPAVRVVLINHEDCGMYKSVANLFKHETITQQKNDVLRTVSLVKTLHPERKHIEGYMGRLEHGGENKKIYFEKVT